MEDAALAKLLLKRGLLSPSQLASLLAELKPGELRETVLQRGWVTPEVMDEVAPPSLGGTTHRYVGVIDVPGQAAQADPDLMTTHLLVGEPPADPSRTTVRFGQVLQPDEADEADEADEEDEAGEADEADEADEAGEAGEEDERPSRPGKGTTRVDSPEEVPLAAAESKGDTTFVDTAAAVTKADAPEGPWKPEDANAMTSWDQPALTPPLQDDNASTSWDAPALVIEDAEAEVEDPAAKTHWEDPEVEVEDPAAKTHWEDPDAGEGDGAEEVDEASKTHWEDTGGDGDEGEDAGGATLWDADEQQEAEEARLASGSYSAGGGEASETSLDGEQEVEGDSTLWEGTPPQVATAAPLGDGATRGDDASSSAAAANVDPNATHADLRLSDSGPSGEAAPGLDDRTQWGEEGEEAPMRGLSAYLLVEELGRGGMGMVYRAEDTRTGRHVAVKRILLATPSPTAQARFRREGQLAARLNHPGILAIHECGSEGVDGLYLVMELVEGARTLDEACKDLDLAQRVELVRQAAEALGHAHERDVIHRDVKPDNLLVDLQGRVRVADFGLASSSNLERLTQSGTQVGTPSYMAPEQVTGDRASQVPATDVWALGVVLYEVLTGTHPFKAASTFQLFRLIQAGGPVPPRSLDSSIPRDLEAVCLKALSVEHYRRYANGGAMAADLQRALRGERIVARPVSRWGKGLQRLRWLLAPALAIVFLVGVVATLGPFSIRAGGASDQRAPRLSIESPESGATIRTAKLTIRGHVNDDEGVVQVWVLDHESSRVEARSDGSFTLSLQLEPGFHDLEVHASDSQGLFALPVPVKVQCLAGLPAWYTRLEVRPRLPAGLLPTPQPREYRWEQDGSLLVYVPPGRFTFGGPPNPFFNASSPMFRDWDLPGPRAARITRGYFIGKYEVSWEQFDRFCAGTSREARDRRFKVVVVPGDDPGTMRSISAPDSPLAALDTWPVTLINRFDADSYCVWAGLRLPTELEWEYAAEGPTGGPYPWGEEKPHPGLLNRCDAKDVHPHTAPASSYAAGVSPFGCFHMAGNARELVSDGFAPYPEGQLPDDYHHAMQRGEGQVLRGGAWSKQTHLGFLTYVRLRSNVDERSISDGFRVALSEPEEGE